MKTFDKVFSARVLFGSIAAGAIVGALASMLWHPLGMPVTVAVFLLTWFGTVVDPSTVVKCPCCHKRVKVGATVCHHCGRDTT